MSQVIALDTNAVTALLKNNKGVNERIPDNSQLFIPLAVYGELLSGAQSAPNAAKLVAVIHSFLAKNYVQVSTGMGHETVRLYVNMYIALRRAGTPISPNDMWIAAECLERDLPLLTFDKDFHHVKDLTLI